MGQLLAHRSGLPLSILVSVNQYDDLLSQANATGERGPVYPPGSKFWYSDAGSDVLGAVIEKVCGQSLDEFWAQNIFEPLGMKETFVPLDNDDPRWDRLASSYVGQAGQWTPLWDQSKEMLIPGEIEYRTMQQRKQRGIPLPNNLYEELVALAKELGVKTKLSVL